MEEGQRKDQELIQLREEVSQMRHNFELYDKRVGEVLEKVKNESRAQEEEANFGNQYKSWTPNLLRAAYNYQMAYKDPGNFAHGGKYTIQLLVDSIEALGGDVSGLAREDAGHFAGNTDAFRHWDEDGEVEADCAKCHSSTGLSEFIEAGGTMGLGTVVDDTGDVTSGQTLVTGVGPQEISNGFWCTTCHDGANWPALYEVNAVVFPSGKVVSFGGQDADGNFVANNSNLCLECHQGRASKVSLDAAIGAGEFTFSDQNVHYFAAGATLFGADVVGLGFAWRGLVGQRHG